MKGSFDSDISNDGSRTSVFWQILVETLFVDFSVVCWRSTSSPIFSTPKVPPRKEKKKKTKKNKQ